MVDVCGRDRTCRSRERVLGRANRTAAGAAQCSGDPVAVGRGGNRDTSDADTDASSRNADARACDAVAGCCDSDADSGADEHGDANVVSNLDLGEWDRHHVDLPRSAKRLRMRYVRAIGRRRRPRVGLHGCVYGRDAGCDVCDRRADRKYTQHLYGNERLDDER